jgi:hypothetical protein
MALSKQTIYDAVTIRPTGHVEIRMKITVTDDSDNSTWERYFRRVIEPTDDITGEPLKIRQICNIARS